uniref:CWH43-like N-terminal domain-containing protein n=1 Tax=Monopterus albus TaxID=43700 RepID=A0A3Q3KRT9_MONAL|nr:DNA damage-regulated autophagy modulator protein 2-like isoform X1 [Monopterus albus]
MWWFQKGLCILPVGVVVWMTTTFVVSYIIAVVLGHVDPLVPYISDLGTTAPERCVFGIMMNVSAFFGIATIFVRYKLLKVITGENKLILHKLNGLGLVFGCISCFGMCVVGNFQRTTMFSVHIVGAVLTFGVGALYILVQTLLSFNMQPHIHSKTVYLVRLGISVWTLSSIIALFVSSVIMYSSLPSLDAALKLHWVPGETAYTAHIFSTISEWSLSFSFIGFFFTYIRDFQKINLRTEAVLQSNHLYEQLDGDSGVSSHSQRASESPLPPAGGT